jgi:hypothetical protein
VAASFGDADHDTALAESFFRTGKSDVGKRICLKDLGVLDCSLARIEPAMPQLFSLPPACFCMQLELFLVRRTDGKEIDPRAGRDGSAHHRLGIR